MKRVTAKHNYGDLKKGWEYTVIEETPGFFRVKTGLKKDGCYLKGRFVGFSEDHLNAVPRHEIPMPEGDWGLVVDHIRKFLPANQAGKPMSPMDVIAYISQLRSAATLLQQTNADYEERTDNLTRGARMLGEENTALNAQLRSVHGVVRDLAAEVRLLSVIIRGDNRGQG